MHHLCYGPLKVSSEIALRKLNEHTPLYNKAILVTEKHPAEIFFFGRFLVRLSESDHSQVLSIAGFFYARSN